jgi:hypothetical protein
MPCFCFIQGTDQRLASTTNKSKSENSKKACIATSISKGNYSTPKNQEGHHAKHSFVEGYWRERFRLLYVDEITKKAVIATLQIRANVAAATLELLKKE